MQDQPKPSRKKKQSLTDYGRFSAMAFQMVVIIAAGVWGGRKLDEYFCTGFPGFTIALSLFSVAAAIYLSVKDLFKKK